jgi:NhaC family Na+:H+ antiporter
MNDSPAKDPKKGTRAPSLFDALFPVLFLMSLLMLSVYLFRTDATWGPNQIALIFSSMAAALIGMKNGVAWDTMTEGVVRSISQALPAIFILLGIGALIGTWAMSGTIGTMIYYGLQVLDPKVFYPSVVVVTALVSASIGSSWTTAGTVGVGMIGIAHGLGMSEAITAGAIVSGSYFGDKLSPLSDTTNLAPAVAGPDLYTHIRHMVWTTTPSMLIALGIFTLIGLNSTGSGAMEVREETIRALTQYYEISPWLLLPLAAVMLMALLRWKPFPVIILGALLGGIFAVIFQPDMVAHYINRPELSTPLAMIAGVWKAMYSGYEVATGFPIVDKLLNRGGMGSMLEVIWLVLSALMFGGVMEAAGLLRRLLDAIVHLVKGTSSLIVATLATALGLNIVTSDQYMAIVLTGRMYRLEYQRRGLAPENLSRAVEDSGTLTSPLVPWSACGAYMAGTLGVATLTYLPFAFFNWINPLVALVMGLKGWSVKRIEPEETSH